MSDGRTPEGDFLPDPDFPLLLEPPSEVESRRDDWTAGGTVVMGDGTTWHLPRLDGAFLATHADLVADLSRQVGESPDDADWADDQAGTYARQIMAMHDIGLRLLEANYHLGPLGICRFPFFGPDELSAFALAVSDALARDAQMTPAGSWEAFEADATAGCGLILFHN